MPILNLPNPQIDYSSRDFASIMNDLIGRIPIFTPEWTNFNASDPGIVQLELYAYVADGLHYYLDRAVNEALWNSAILRSSLISDSKLMAYTPTSVEAASVDLSIHLAAVQLVDVVIPAGFQFNTEGDTDMIFETVEEWTIPAGDLFRDEGSGEVFLGARQLVSDTLGIGTSDGTAGQSFEITTENIARDLTQIFVTESAIRRLWSTTKSFFFVGTTARSYTDELSSEGNTLITFGDGFNGRVPDKFAPIEAVIHVSRGSEGNVGPATITEVTTPLLISGNEIELVVTNALAATGGADEESVASIKSQAPQSLSALNRGVTGQDLGALATTVSGVLLAQSSIVSRVLRVYIISVVPEGGGLPSTLLKQDVEDFLDGTVDGIEKQMLGGTLSIVDPKYIGLELVATIIVVAGGQLDDVTEAINAIYAAIFDYGPGKTGFGDDLHQSDIYRAFDEVTSVSHVTISKMTMVPNVEVLNAGAQVAADVTVTTLLAAVNESWTLTFTDNTTFTVSGDISGVVGVGTTGSLFTDPSTKMSVLVAAGAGWDSTSTVTYRQSPLIGDILINTDELIAEGPPFVPTVEHV